MLYILRKVISVVVLVFLLLGLTKCSIELGSGFVKEFKEDKPAIRQELEDLWNNLLNEINDMAELAATQSVTKDDKLSGERRSGVDDYVGTYQCTYKDFSSKEFLFGGTMLKRQAGSDFKAVYSITVSSGKGGLYWLCGDEKIKIADTSEEGTYEFSIGTGKNFIIFEGENFSGTLSLTVE